MAEQAPEPAPAPNMDNSEPWAQTYRTKRQWVFGAQVGSGALLAVGLALPFIRVGQVSRNAYQLISSANRLSLLDGPPARLIAMSIAATPMLVGVLLITSVSTNRLSRTLRIIAVVLLTATGAIVSIAGLTKPGTKLLGPLTTAVATLSLAASATLAKLINVAVRDHRPRRR